MFVSSSEASLIAEKGIHSWPHVSASFVFYALFNKCLRHSGGVTFENVHSFAMEPWQGEPLEKGLDALFVEFAWNSLGWSVFGTFFVSTSHKGRSAKATSKLVSREPYWPYSAITCQGP